MKRPKIRPALRPGLARRLVAGLVSTAYVALALGAGLHAGEHDTSGLEWLPSEFHHHALWLEAQPEPGRAIGSDLCVACQTSRLSLKLDRGASPAPEPAPIGFAGLLRGDDAPASPPFSPRTSRGPPSA